MPKPDTRYSRMEDPDLVVLAQQGDNEAFAELIDRHSATCRRLAVSILKNADDAEDEVQNALWKAFEHIGQFQQDAKFSTWLSRIVVNQCLMRLRKERRARHVSIDEPVSAEDNIRLDLPDAQASPEQALGREELGKVLHTEIRRIPPLLRQVFILRDVEERPMEEISQMLGISVAAAKSRLLRARLELRSRMQKHMGVMGLATLTS
ncbi:MAG: sigma-70 family RNA polymerase sigma factor [Bryobacteraceae bacterium]|nr:sigma-70 family RNA polymerase sigma factor [Bryobacteraceae bacterium]